MAVDIGPKIGIQGEREFREQINQTNQALKTLAAEGKAVTSSFNDETDAEKKAAAQKDVLSRQIETQKDKLALLEKGLKESAQMYGEADTRTMKWQQAVHEATAKLNGMEKELDDVDKSVDESTDSMEDAGDAAKGWADVMKGQLLADAVKTGLKSIANLGKKAASAMWDASKAGAAYADEILTSATVTGLSTEELQEFRYMSDLVDVSVETMTGSLTKLTGTMDKARGGNKEATAAFEKLGVKVTDSNGRLRNSNEVFREVIDALGKMEPGTERDAVAMDILGKSAKDLNPLIEAGADTMAELAKEAHDTGYVLSGDALTALGKQQDAMDRLNRKTEGLKNTFAQGLAPGITKAYDTIGEAMSNPRVQRGTELLGEGIGNIIGKAADLAARVLPDLMAAFSDDIRLREFSDHEIELAENTDKAREAYEKQREAYADNAEAILAETGRVEGLWKELQTLTDESGNVKEADRERVDFILNELNDALGTEYERNGEIITQYQNMQDEIEGLIEKRTAEQLLNAGADNYATAITERQAALQMAGEWAEIVAEREAAISDELEQQKEALRMAAQLKGEYLTEDELTDLALAIMRVNFETRDEARALQEARDEYKKSAETVAGYYADIERYEKAQAAAIQGNYQDAIRYMTDEMGVALEYYAQKDALSEADREKLQTKIRETEQAIAEYKRQLEAGSTGLSKEGLKELEGYVKEAKAILDGKTVGRSWLSGIKTGLESGDLKRQIHQAAQSVASSIRNVTNQTLQIRSPSRVATKIGNYWDMGLIKGMEQKETEIAKAATSLADTITKASTPSGGLSVSYGNGLTAAGTVGGTSSYQTNLGGITIQVSGAGAVNEDILAQRISVRLTDELIRAQRGGRL